MTTYRDVIEQAMQELGVLHASESPSGDETADALTRMNQMLTSWLYDGIDLEFESVTDVDSEVPYPDDHISAFSSNLAVRLAPIFGITPGPVIVAMAQKGKQHMQSRYMVIEPAEIDPAIQTTWNPNHRFL